MADLKTTIAQTENLKNKVKLAKDKINETVVRGGITSKSLSEIPDNINKMLGQYKKIATGTFLLDVTIKKSNTTKIYQHSNFYNDIYELTDIIKIPLNLDFTPSIFYIKIPNGYDYLVHNKYHYEKQNATSGVRKKNVEITYGDAWVYIAKVEQKNAEINFCARYSRFESSEMRFRGECEWTAIG